MVQTSVAMNDSTCHSSTTALHQQFASTNLSRFKGPSCCVRGHGGGEADRRKTCEPTLPHLEDGAAKGVFRWSGRTGHPRDEAHALALAASSLTGLTAWPPTFSLWR